MKKLKLTPKRKWDVVMYTSSILMGLVIAALAIFVDRTFEIPSIVIRVLMWLLVIVLVVGFTKWLERTWFKDSKEEIEKEIDKEVEAMDTTITKGTVIMAALLVFAFLFVIGCTASELLEELMENYRSGKPLEAFLPGFIGLFTMVVFAAVFGGIVYNIGRGRIFVSANANLIYCLGATIFLSTIAQQSCDTLMVPNPTVRMFYFVLACVFFLLSKLFSIAIKMKEDQDLTI